MNEADEQDRSRSRVVVVGPGKGRRADTVPAYHTKLKARRNKAAGTETTTTTKKRRPGQVVKNEIRFLQTRNGLFLTRELTRRVAKRAIHRASDEAREDADWIQSRLRRQSKQAPMSLRVKPADAWTVSGEAVSMLRAALETLLQRTARVAVSEMAYAGRITLNEADVRRADDLCRSGGP